MKYIAPLICLLFFQFGYSQTELKRTAVNDLSEEIQKEKRPIVFFIYTDWCGFCHQMEQQTWTDTDVIQKLNSKYYFTPLNAESEENYTIANMEFQNQTGTNELAVALAFDGKRLAYPSLVILSSEYEIIYQQSGYQSPNEVKQLLNKLEELIESSE